MKVAILGWGIDTKDVVPYLLNRKDEIHVFDRLSDFDKKEFPNLKWHLGRENFGDLSDFDLIVRSPGIYRFRPEIVAAEQKGVKISSKTRIFFDLCPAKIIGVTGTKGKGTTATLIYEILKAAGKDVYLGGNIGEGMFGDLRKLTKNSWIVLELSSFQLIDLHKSPHISVVLMVTSEHLNWHKNEEEYLTAKSQLVRHQKAVDFVVANKDYPHSVKIANNSSGKVIWVTGHDAAQYQTRLRGEHNLENIAAAVAVAKIVGVFPDIITSTVANYAGLEHRLEEVATKGGVTFYNDSFSTTPETAIAAIKAFFEPEIVILGGSSKNSDFTALGKVITGTKNVKAVILIGAEGPRIGREIKNKPVLTGAKNMAEIVKMAYNNAVSGDVVLLSPACASFDMFANYKERGKQFKDEVRKLK